jgi:methyl-accepting chemotaxis protein
MFKEFSLKTKMITAFMGIAFILLAVGGIGIIAMRSVTTKYNHVARTNLPDARTLGKMRYNATDANRALLRMIGATTAEDFKKFEEQFRGAIDKYKAADKDYAGGLFSDSEEALYKAQDSSWKTLSANMIEMEGLLKTKRAEDKARYDELDKSLPKIRKQHADELNSLLEFQDSEAKKWTGDAESTADFARNLSLALVIGGVLGAVLIGYFFSSTLSKALRLVSQQIDEAASQTGSASGQLSGASQQLSSGSTQAAASLEETVASLEELSSMVKLNADHAKEASALSATSRDAAEQGEREITTLISAMAEMAKGSKKIEEIISVIDDIAFQTNLLALNAAVEAARAGEQGKGFAVVAEAVRTLAQRSASAAKDITVLIKDSVEKSQSGSKIAETSGAVLKNIVTSVKKVADLNNEISSASQEQSTGISQISKAMNQLDQATQSNAASAEEVAASSEEMSSQANALLTLVTDLTVIVEGKVTAKHGSNSHQQAPSHSAPDTQHRSQPKLKLVTQRPGRASSQNAAQVIPFDAPAGKVGNTEGF